MTIDVSERILDVAQDFIMERGYKAFSYKDISEKIGIKTSSIHYHYPSKSDLGKKLARRYTCIMSDEIKKIDESTSDPIDKLKKYFNIFYEGLKSGTRVCPIAMLSSDYANLPEDIRIELIELIRSQEIWLAGVLESGLGTKKFNFTGSAGDKAKAVFFAIEGATIASRVFSEPERIRFAEAMIFDSIK